MSTKHSLHFDDLLLPRGARSGIALSTSWVGDTFLFETLIQNPGGDATLYNKVMELPDQYREPLQYQGSDFMGGYVFSTFIGINAVWALNNVSRFLLPEKRGLATFIENNPILLRDGIGFLGMATGEALVNYADNKPLDVPDIVAYGTGILTFGYGDRIARSFYEAGKEVYSGARQRLFPTPQEKLEKQLRL
jgi:hypothetical protein